MGQAGKHELTHEIAVSLDEMDQAPLLGERPEQGAPHTWPRHHSRRAPASITARTIIISLVFAWLATLAALAFAVRLARASAGVSAWPWPAEVDLGCPAHSSWELVQPTRQTIDLANAASLPEWIDPAVPLAEFDDEGPANFTALAALCAATEFVPGRWMSSEDGQGGIGNVRNIVLTLLRYTIASGAGFVLPSVMLRAAEVNGDVENLHRGGRAMLDFFFDVPFLRAQLVKHCPQMPVAADLYHVEGLENAVFPDPFWPPDLRSLATGRPPSMPRPSPEAPGVQEMDPETHRQDLDAFVGLPRAANKPQILRLQRTLFQYPIATDPPAFFASFGRLLRLHPVARVLASQTLAEVAALGGGYMGVHLRLEGDAAEAWGTPEEQTSAYVTRILASGLKVVYVASGDPAPVARFEQLLGKRAPAVRLVTKHSLLAAQPGALAKLDALHFDQQALVDYLLLLKSNYLVGTAVSSFSVNALIKRHLSLPGQMAAPELFRVGQDERTFLIRDRVSKGMRETMWP